MCWDHVKINVHTKYTLNKQYQQMKHDIDIFQHATTQTMFEKASNLFVQRWMDLDQEYAACIEKTWINSSIMAGSMAEHNILSLIMHLNLTTILSKIWSKERRLNWHFS